MTSDCLHANPRKGPAPATQRAVGLVLTAILPALGGGCGGGETARGAEPAPTAADAPSEVAAAAPEATAAPPVLVAAPPPELPLELEPSERGRQLELERELLTTQAPGRLAQWQNLRQRLSLEPEAAELHAELGELFYAGDLMSLAEREHLLAVQLDDTLGRSHLVLGEIYLSRADHTRALWHLERARRELPSDPKPYEREALVLREAGDEAGALALVEAGLEVAPFDPELHVVHGLLHLDAGRFEAAERELRAALEVNPDHLRAHLLLGQVLTELGRDGEAAAELDQHARLLLLEKGGVLAKDPPWPEWRRAAALASYHLGMGAKDLARREAERSLAERPGNAEASGVLAQLGEEGVR